MRIVLDSNIFVSALISGEGYPGQVLAAVRRERITLVTSTFQIEELREGAEVAGRVEALGTDGAPRFLLEDPAVDLEVPVDLQGLPLGVVVRAREADAR